MKLISANDLSIPRKSDCFFCPFQRLSQWEELYRNYPDLYGRAENMERNSRSTFRNDGIGLTILRERFEAKGGDLFPDYDYEELTPCVCLT